MRNLIFVFGDQLNANSAAFDGFDPDADAIAMAEVTEGASNVPQHKMRLALFFSAMRHFAADQRAKGRRVLYSALDDSNAKVGLADELDRRVRAENPDKLIIVRPGDHRVLRAVTDKARSLDLAVEVRPDRHFLTDDADFAAFAEGRKELVLEGFYRRVRRDHDLLMEGGDPVGGQWNFDADNRKSFGHDGPPMLPAPYRPRLDGITRGVIEMVQTEFPDAPGILDAELFDYPVTADQARRALEDFIDTRLPYFGDYQDAMVAGRPARHRRLFHSRLSAALNLKLLDPRLAIDRAIQAHADGRAPLNAVEGFVRQIAGWREYVRGIYWRFMPDYAEMNVLEADAAVPDFFWTGETDMACIRDAMTGLLDTAYAHHIERLMVLGQYGLLAGVQPYAMHNWHMGLYADAIDWVSLPNVLGMSQYADGGIVGSKPYCASGAYIDRMSDHCRGCRYDPKASIGADACPFTTLYWDFLDRHEERFSSNRRMGLQLKNLQRKNNSDRVEIRKRAERLRAA